MASREALVKKIQGLLALGDSNRNDSDEEARLAMLKAQELMVKYDISVEEVSDEKPEYSNEVCESKWDYAYRFPLANVLADNFRCRLYMRGKKLVFMGHSSDAKICKATFEYAYKFIMRRGNSIYNKRYAAGKTTKGVFNSYAHGFIVGLKQAFDEQCVALRIVTPDDVVKKFEELTENWKETETKNIGEDVTSVEVWNEGNKDGKQFMNKKKLEN